MNNLENFVNSIAGVIKIFAFTIAAGFIVGLFLGILFKTFKVVMSG